MILQKYSIGIGDRFAHQGRAQLQAVITAREHGADVVPVWNKSHREHVITGTTPADVRVEADAAVRGLGWLEPYHVDADHINLGNVEAFLEPSDFFTLDVADQIGGAVDDRMVDGFVRDHGRILGELKIPGIEYPVRITEPEMRRAAGKFLAATAEAGAIYRHLAEKKGENTFITEVSIDECDEAQSPVELLLILTALAAEGIPLQTIAPKFTGRFNKGVDYVGDIRQFDKEFNEDLAVVAFAVRELGLPENLKLSVHSGSDKFSIYACISRAIRKFDAGLHLKTAGTTWLEELIGLALAGGGGLALAKEIYRRAVAHFEDLCAPYAAVIDIDRARLPLPAMVDTWDGPAFTAALRHDPACAAYNPHFRQLLHVAYKMAAAMGSRYFDALDKYEATIAEQVTENIYQRHLRPVFMGGQSQP